MVPPFCSTQEGRGASSESVRIHEALVCYPDCRLDTGRAWSHLAPDLSGVYRLRINDLLGCCVHLVMGTPLLRNSPAPPTTLPASEPSGGGGSRRCAQVQNGGIARHHLPKLAYR